MLKDQRLREQLQKMVADKGLHWDGLSYGAMPVHLAPGGRWEGRWDKGFEVLRRVLGSHCNQCWGRDRESHK